MITRAVKLWMTTKKRKKVAYKTSRGAVAPQAGQNDEAKSVTQADAGTHTEVQEELVQLEEKEQEVLAKVFCLDEDHEESDSEADDSGWEDPDDNNEDYFSD